jgi:hypothetical protein
MRNTMRVAVCLALGTGLGACGGALDTGAQALRDASAEVPDSSDEATAVQRRVLCDGTPRLRFHAFESQGGGQIEGAIMQIQNGLPALAIDGTCHYWISAGWGDSARQNRYRGWRTGELGEEARSALERVVGFDDLSVIGPCDPNPACADCGGRGMRNERSAISCQAMGTRFASAWAAIKNLAPTLWGQGTEMSVPLRVATQTAGWTYDSPAPWAWPLSRPMDDFNVWKTNLMGGVVSDPTELSQLRALRDSYLDTYDAADWLSSRWLWDGLPAAQGDDYQLVFMRDVLPYEDTNGHLRVQQP